VFSFLVNLHSRLIGADLRREEGQALVEYGLILTFVAVACVLALTTLGEDIAKLLEKIGGKL
jgi:pilus assembly protein Flp/PilA